VNSRASVIQRLRALINGFGMSDGILKCVAVVVEMMISRPAHHS
jgi:hypothetical protein